jgi:hypothetical protein
MPHPPLWGKMTGDDGWVIIFEHWSTHKIPNLKNDWSILFDSYIIYKLIFCYF